MQAAGLPPDTVSYNAVIAAHTKRGDADAVLCVLADMRASGVAPSVVTYGSVVHALHDAGRLAEAQALYREAAGLGLFQHWRGAGGARVMDLLTLSRGAAVAALSAVLDDMAAPAGAPACGGVAHAPSSDLHIIAGSGRARGGASGGALQPAIRTMLAARRVACERDPGNPGRLIVRAHELQRFVNGCTGG